ncbi:MAG: hypothetical protein WAT23_18070 [Chromatiaceae bacterium]
MTSRFDWDAQERHRRARTHGTEYAYDELPPIGSSGDRRRYCYGDVSEIAKPINVGLHTIPLQKVRKANPTKDERLRNIFRELGVTVAIPGSTKWHKRGLVYQQNLLLHLRNSLNSLLKLDPSKDADPVVIKAKQILAEYVSGAM